MIFDLLILLLVVFLSWAVLSKKMLSAAIFFAFASVVASIIFFILGAFWIAIFELTVVAGLITVIFISSISLTRGDSEEIERNYSLILFPFVFILVSGLIISLVIKMSPHLFLVEDTLLVKRGFREVFWGDRKLDIWGQMLIILVGVFGINSFFPKKIQKKNKKSFLTIGKRKGDFEEGEECL